MKQLILTSILFVALLTVPTVAAGSAKAYYSQTVSVADLEVGDYLAHGASLKFEGVVTAVTVIDSYDDSKAPLMLPSQLATLHVSVTADEVNVHMLGASGSNFTGNALQVTAIADGSIELHSVRKITLELDNTTGSIYWMENYTNQLLDVTLAGRTLYRDGRWQTLCLPFDRSKQQLQMESSPLYGAEIRTLQSATLEDGTLTLQFQKTDAVEAGRPYLVRWPEPKAPDRHEPQFQNVVITSTSPVSVSRDVAEMVGVFRPVKLTAGNQNQLYLGGDNRLYYPVADVTVYAFRAYVLLHPALGTAPIQQCVLSFGDDVIVGSTDAVASPLAAPSTDAPAYSLGGLLQPSVGRGLHVVKGRKYLIK